MHYRHRFHAGNFADVFKHVLLVALGQALSRKDTPWCALETHAGAGAYDLSHEDAGRTGEWREGIGRLLEGAVPAPLAPYMEAVRACLGDDGVLRYPGSPLLLRAIARESDRLVLCEKVPEILSELRETMGRDRRVTIHERDGYEAHSLLPPKEKRGLVLVDPPFEAPDEFDKVAEFLKRSLARFANGIYAVWYPVKNRHESERFERRVARESGRPALACTFDTDAPTSGKLRACGLLVVNPPFGFDRDAAVIGRALVERLGQGMKAAFTVQALATDAPARKN